MIISKRYCLFFENDLKIMRTAEKGAIYEFRLSAKNQHGFGEEANATIQIPGGHDRRIQCWWLGLGCCGVVKV